MTDRWFKHWRVGRLQLRITFLRHRYAVGPDRWVLQSAILFDRKGDSF
jgi:hypothetical protein